LLGNVKEGVDMLMNALISGGFLQLLRILIHPRSNDGIITAVLGNGKPFWHLFPHIVFVGNADALLATMETFQAIIKD
jgi:hypothetical protein